ncbi:DUF3836 domain-containing protein [Dysgonomonas sp. 511]|uniref:DUF3836 domain-containing protein n=1 Tax=Dysgonomonas sp. 511 TaxID=2302930 RepID=UPI0013D57C34|nr:DUF3836 domain-containing protein [Dysgonomonas sp. 511]NDV79379.1 DUF3836 domain-containing protein [Dysgonomonas sp. 511]
MKAKFFFLFVMILGFTASIHADSRETITFSNVEKTENGSVKEILHCNKYTNAPLLKTVYNYDADGRLLEKTLYEWNSNMGWVGTQKYQYNYSEDNQLLSPTFSKWDKKNKCWADKSK